MTYKEIAVVFNDANVKGRTVDGKQGQNWILIGPTAEFRLSPATLYARVEQRSDDSLTIEQGYKTREEAELPEAGVKVLPAVQYTV